MLPIYKTVEKIVAVVKKVSVYGRKLHFFAVSCVVCEGLKTEDLKIVYLKSEDSKDTFMGWEPKDLVIDQVLADGNLFR